MITQDEQKRRAAERAVELVEDGMKLGLGTGSTARRVLEALAARRGRGELAGIVGVPTSKSTESYARELGIPLATLDEETHLDLTLDGADEVDPGLDLIKGLGGALLWEKIVAAATDRLVIVVDESKLVTRLGLRSPLPVEVVPFGWRTHLDPLRAMGAEFELRKQGNGSPFVTDGGHYIIDCGFPGGIENPERVEARLKGRPGVVETGLFLGMADTVVVAGAEGVRVLRAESRR
ncbi:MAG TPA: ribose-5-phosphate isomerase RpiA [Longimicrobiales bacterium]|nr:ribose-5-phosphate isomerase RpiA [Longimicrobiales bacterium]